MHGDGLSHDLMLRAWQLPVVLPIAGEARDPSGEPAGAAAPAVPGAGREQQGGHVRGAPFTVAFQVRAEVVDWNVHFAVALAMCKVDHLL